MPWLFEAATGRRALYALGVMIGGGGLLFGVGPFVTVQQRTEGRLIPEQQLGLEPERLAEFLGAIGAEGRAAYLQFQALDLLWPVLTGAAGGLTIAWLLKRSGTTSGLARVLPLTPTIVLVAEIGENSILAQATRAFPEMVPAVAALPVLTGTKFAGLALVVGLIAACGLRLLWRQRFSGDAER